MRKKVILTAVFIILGIFGRQSIVHAETNLVISPSVVKVIAKPGVDPVISFILENKGNPVLMKLQVLPFIPSDSLGHLEFGKELKGPISFEVQELPTAFTEPFLLKSNTQQPISLQLHLPSGVEEKDYYFSLLAQTTPFPSQEGETTLRFVSRIGAHILLTVSSDGKIEQKASIPIFEVPESSTPFFKTTYDTSDGIPVTLMIKNDGRNVIKPLVTISVKGWNIQKRYTLTSQNILASSQRLMIDSSCDQSCNGSFSLLLHGLFIGKYTVTASVNSYSGSQSTIAMTTFIAFPFKISFYILI